MLILAIEILVSCGKQMGFYAPQVPVHLGPAVCPVLLPRHWKGPVLDRWFDNVGKRIMAEKLTAFLTQLITIKNQAEKCCLWFLFCKEIVEHPLEWEELCYIDIECPDALSALLFHGEGGFWVGRAH